MTTSNALATTAVVDARFFLPGEMFTHPGAIVWNDGKTHRAGNEEVFTVDDHPIVHEQTVYVPTVFGEDDAGCVEIDLGRMVPVGFPAP